VDLGLVTTTDHGTPPSYTRIITPFKQLIQQANAIFACVT
jgi:hypothetical protein